MGEALELVGDIRASAMRRDRGAAREVLADGALTRAGGAAAQSGEIEQLGKMVLAYHRASEQLRASHETLLDQVGRLQSQLASTDAQLQRSQRLAALGEMAAGIAHEVRNPLAAIQLYTSDLIATLSVLPGCTPGDEAVYVAQRIDDAVRGLDRLVSDVLSFARELRPAVRSLSAADPIEKAVELARPALDQAGAKVSIAIDGDPQLAADGDLVGQAVLNLLRNAAEATADTPGDRRIVIDAGIEGRWCTIAVSDNGQGIAADVFERIFNPFVSTRDAGTGLGLAIVHRIADAHGGTIAAANQPGGGARFTLYLPAASEAADEMVRTTHADG